MRFASEITRSAGDAKPRTLLLTELSASKERAPDTAERRALLAHGQFHSDQGPFTHVNIEERATAGDKTSHVIQL